MQLGAKGVPFVVTHDGRTIRYPDPAIKVCPPPSLPPVPSWRLNSPSSSQVNDTVKFDLTENKIVDHVKFEAGNLVMATGGRNMGRSGVIVHRERHLGGFDIVRIRDVLDREFSTRIGNVFVTGQGNKPWVSLPKGKGVKLSVRFLSLGGCGPWDDWLTRAPFQITEERDQRRKIKEKNA